jgi:hypothetical protein
MIEGAPGWPTFWIPPVKAWREDSRGNAGFAGLCAPVDLGFADWRNCVALRDGFSYNGTERRRI